MRLKAHTVAIVACTRTMCVDVCLHVHVHALHTEDADAAGGGEVDWRESEGRCKGHARAREELCMERLR